MKIHLEILMKWSSIKMWWFGGRISLVERRMFPPPGTTAQPFGSQLRWRSAQNLRQNLKAQVATLPQKRDLCKSSNANALHKTKDKPHKGVVFENGVADAPHKKPRVRGTSASLVKSWCWCTLPTSASIPLRVILGLGFAKQNPHKGVLSDVLASQGRLKTQVRQAFVVCLASVCAQL